MTKKYIGKSPRSLKEVFYKKQNMKFLIFDQNRGSPERTGGPSHHNILDFHDSEFVLFGKVNKFFLPILPTKDSLKTFKSDYLNAPTGDTEAMDFVVDQFELMAQQFQKAVMNGSISSKDPYLSELKIHRAYQDPYRLYNQYLGLLITALKGRMKAEKIQIGNFDEFMALLLGMLKNSALEFPLTLPAYVKSRHYSPTNSGMVLEIAQLDYNDNKQTVEQFYQSLNWQYWLNTCDAYGFIVDGNAPWRIMADLDSQSMRKAALRYGSGGARSVLTNNFRSAAHIFILKQFIPTLLKIYNALRSPKLVKVEVCKDNTLQTSLQEGETYDLETLQGSYSLEYFTQQYFQIRFLEEESQFTPNARDALIRDSLRYIKINGAYYAILYFESILNKPFDYQGSMSYYIKARKAFEAQQRSPAERKAEMREIQRETHRIRQKKGLTED